jgi:hypothetical protein
VADHFAVEGRRGSTPAASGTLLHSLIVIEGTTVLPQKTTPDHYGDSFAFFLGAMQSNATFQMVFRIPRLDVHHPTFCRAFVAPNHALKVLCRPIFALLWTFWMHAQLSTWVVSLLLTSSSRFFKGTDQWSVAIHRVHTGRVVACGAR